MVVGLLIAWPGEDELHLPGVASPGGQKRVAGALGRGVRAPSQPGRGGRRSPGEGLPEQRRGVQEEQVDVAFGGQGAQHPKLTRRQPGEPEQRQPAWEVEQRSVGAQPRARRAEPLRRPRLADAVAQVAPQLRLPARAVGQRPTVPVAIRALRPSAHHVRTVAGVAVKELGHVANGGEPAGPADGVGRVDRAAQIDVQSREPRLREVLLDHLEQRPGRPLGEPGIALRVDARGGGQRVGDEPAGGREGDVGAHAVAAAG